MKLSLMSYYIIVLFMNLLVPYIDTQHEVNPDIKDVNFLLDKQDKQFLENVIWVQPSQLPKVGFTIAYDRLNIYLKFYVTEPETRTEVQSINGNVWEDSCVEFFISFDNETYYNIEFNSAGVGLVGFGKNKTDRILLPLQSVSGIIATPSFEKSDNGNHWQLLLAIPFHVFLYNKIDKHTLRGKTFKSNFYKCGDKLKAPHFIAWSPIVSEFPNFHLPEYFGEISFL